MRNGDSTALITTREDARYQRSMRFPSYNAKDSLLYLRDYKRTDVSI